jgi:hypothetical protein
LFFCGQERRLLFLCFVVFTIAFNLLYMLLFAISIGNHSQIIGLSISAERPGDIPDSED